MQYKLHTSWAIYFFLLVSSAVSDYTYWVDSTCHEKFGDQGDALRSVMEEIIGTARVMRLRMNQDRDAHPWEWVTAAILYDFAYDEPTVDGHRLKGSINNMLDVIGGFRAEPDSERKASEIRIHCDNDDRHEPVPDDRTMYEYLPSEIPVNSQREEQWKEWQDPINKVRSLGLPACKRQGDERKATGVYGVTYKYGDDPQEHRYRISITICDLWFELIGERFKTIQSTADNNQLHNLDARNLSGILTLALLFAIMHHNRLNYVRRASEWDDLIRLGRNEAWSNAQTNAMFLGLVRLLDEGYSVRALDAQTNGPITEQTQEMSYPGELQYNQTLPIALFV